jgi:hypothetical protein
MLVGVVEMRRNGQKLDAAELRAAVPVRGVLIVTTNPATRAGDPGTTYATLTNPRMSEPLLPALREAHVSKLKGTQFIITGLETIVPKIGSSTTHPQAWWCRLVEDSTNSTQQHASPDNQAQQHEPLPR